MSNKNRSLLTLLLVVLGVIAANYLAFRSNSDTGDIANNTFSGVNYFFPATYVFTTIWPVIYAGLLGWGVYQALPSNRDSSRLKAVAPWMVVNIALNALWVLVFGMEAFVSTLPIMIALVFVTLVIYRKLEVGVRRVATWERLIHITISIYLAWLTVATVANVAAALISVNWDGFGLSYEMWALLMLLVGVGLALLLYRGLNNDVVIPLTYIYAYVGILVRYRDEGLVLAGAVIGIVVLAALVVWHFVKGRGRALALGQP